MDRFRKARYAVALLAIPLTGAGFATRIGEHSIQYVLTVYLLLAGMFALTVAIAYADQSASEYLS